MTRKPLELPFMAPVGPSPEGVLLFWPPELTTPGCCCTVEDAGIPIGSEACAGLDETGS